MILIVATPLQAANAFVMAGSMPQVGCGVMLRHPRHDPHAVLKLCRQVAAQGHLPGNITLISNTVRAPEIPALHLTSAQLNTTMELPERGAGAIVGFSTHTIAQVQRATAMGADYITFSPVFPTVSKPGHPGTGLQVLKQICHHTPLPVFALGGITPDNCRQCVQAGARGVAGISFARSSGRNAMIACLQDLFGIRP